MKNLFIFFLIILSGCKHGVLKEPTLQKGGIIELGNDFCCYDSADSVFIGDKKITIHTPNEKQIAFVNNIIDYSGINLNIKLYEADIPNALATKINGEIYILFKKKFLEDADKSSDTYWHTGFILAHEIAHHLYNHNFTTKDTSIRYKQELEADNFAGFILYRLGADIEQTSLIFKKSILNENNKVLTHPKKSRRLSYVLEGWRKANTQQYNIPAPPPPIFTNEDRDYILSFFDDRSIDCDDLFGKIYDGTLELRGYAPSCSDIDSTLLSYYPTDTLEGAIIKLYNTIYEQNPLPNWIICTSTMIRLNKPITDYFNNKLTNTLEIELYENPLFNSKQRGEGTNIAFNKGFQLGQRIKFKLLPVHEEGMIPILYFSYLDFIPSK